MTQYTSAAIEIFFWMILNAKDRSGKKLNLMGNASKNSSSSSQTNE
jgi:hypothetical protein